MYMYAADAISRPYFQDNKILAEKGLKIKLFCSATALFYMQQTL